MIGEPTIETFWTNDHREWYRNVYLRSSHWLALKRKKLSQCPRCERCASTAKLDVHHRNYRSLFDVQMTDLLTLCRLCHDAEHAALGIPKRSRKPLRDCQSLPRETKLLIRNQNLPKYLNFISYLADRHGRGKPIGNNLIKRLHDLQRMIGCEVAPG